MEAKISKTFARFDPPNWRSVAVARTGILTRLHHSNRDAWMRSAAYGSLVEALRFSQGSQFGERLMMLYATSLEIYCCLGVTEIGIVAWSRHTDVTSGKEVTVPQ